MKIFLRTKTGQFYTGKTKTAQWSQHESKAMGFATCSAVETLCAERGFRDVEIMALYDANRTAMYDAIGCMVRPVKLPPLEKSVATVIAASRATC